MVWQKNFGQNTHYDITYSQDYLDEHNETTGWSDIYWDRYLYPATQGNWVPDPGTYLNSLIDDYKYLTEPNLS